jgi:hypothetical protein
MSLDSKSYEAYRKNGFVAGIPVFSAQSVAEIRGEIEALEAQYSERGRDNFGSKSVGLVG